MHAISQTIHMSNEDPQQPMDGADQGPSENPTPSGTAQSVLRGISDLLRPLAISRFRIIDLADPEQTIAGIKKDIVD